MRRADREVGKRIEARAHEASLRMKEVVRRIEKGDVQLLPLPGKREDSMESMKSIESADYATEVSQEAQQAAEGGES
jgi:hypothetical protein